MSMDQLQASAQAFSSELKIMDVRAGLSPEDKLVAVKSLRSDAQLAGMLHDRLTVPHLV